MWMRNRAGDEIEIEEPANPGDPEFQDEISRRMAAGYRQIKASGDALEPCCGDKAEEAEGGEG